MKMFLAFGILIFITVIFLGCTGQPAATVNQPQGQPAQQPTQENQGSTALNQSTELCTPTQEPVAIGVEDYNCLDSHAKGLSMTLESVQAGVACTDQFTQGEVRARLQLKAHAYNEKYNLFFSGTLKDDLGGTYESRGWCNNDLINPNIQRSDSILIGDSLGACKTNCDLSGAVYFDKLNPNAKTFTVTIDGYKFAFSADEVK